MSYHSDVAYWKSQAKASKSRYVIVMIDTFDGDCYPVYASTEEQLRDILWEKDGNNMQKAEEIHDVKTGEINYCPYTLRV